MGTPSSIQDVDVDISLPEEDDLGISNAALKLHVKLAALEGKVMAGEMLPNINFETNTDFLKLHTELTGS